MPLKALTISTQVYCPLRSSRSAPVKDRFPMLKYHSPDDISKYPYIKSLWLVLNMLDLKNTTVTLGYYQAVLEKKLGQGVEGRTYLVRVNYFGPMVDAANTFFVVVKKIKSGFVLVKKLLSQRECRFYKQHGDRMHEFGPGFYHADDMTHTIVTEVAQPFDMDDHAGFYPQIKCDLMATLRKIHSEGVVHNDIKLDNIAFVRNMWRFLDYGMATEACRPGIGKLAFSYPGQLVKYTAGLAGYREEPQKGFNEDWRRLVILLLQVYHQKTLQNLLVERGYIHSADTKNVYRISIATGKLIKDLQCSSDPEERVLASLVTSPPQEMIEPRRHTTSVL